MNHAKGHTEVPLSVSYPLPKFHYEILMPQFFNIQIFYQSCNGVPFIMCAVQSSAVLQHAILSVAQ